jgi:hypothetical protein
MTLTFGWEGLVLLLLLFSPFCLLPPLFFGDAEQGVFLFCSSSSYLRFGFDILH